MLWQGTATQREAQKMVNGATNSIPASEPAADTGCCSSRTCVTNDYYEIEFDRPGCMQSPDYLCYMPQSVDTIQKLGSDVRYFK